MFAITHTTTCLGLKSRHAWGSMLPATRNGHSSLHAQQRYMIYVHVCLTRSLRRMETNLDSSMHLTQEAQNRGSTNPNPNPRYLMKHRKSVRLSVSGVLQTKLKQLVSMLFLSERHADCASVHLRHGQATSSSPRAAQVSPCTTHQLSHHYIHPAGFAPRDVTPEATRAVVEKLATG